MAILRNEAGDMGFTQDVVGLLLLFDWIFRNAHIECFSATNQVNQSLHGFFYWRYSIVAMAVEDIEIVKTAAVETLVTTGYEVFA